MGRPDQRGVTLPREVVDEVKGFLREHPDAGHESVAGFVRTAIGFYLAVERLGAEMLEEWRTEKSAGPKYRLWKLLDLVDKSTFVREDWEAAYRILVDALVSWSPPRCPVCRNELENVGTRKAPSWRCGNCGWRSGVEMLGEPVRKGARTG